MQGYDVRARNQLFQIANLFRVSVGQLCSDVVIDHLHTQGLGHYRDLRPDIAVADDAESLTAKLKAAGCVLEPNTLVRSIILFGDSADKDDCEADDQLGNRASV